MSEVKHTPGPWVWRGKDGGLYQEGTTHRFGDAVLVPSYEYDSGVDITVSEPDMALIAAAPEMLEALKAMVERVGPRWFLDQNWAEPLDAIAKAEGRS